MENLVYKFPTLWTNDAIETSQIMLNTWWVKFKIKIIERDLNKDFYITFRNVLFSKFKHHDDVSENEPGACGEIIEILNSSWIADVKTRSHIDDFDVKNFRHYRIGFDHGPWMSCICNQIFVDTYDEMIKREHDPTINVNTPGVFVSDEMQEYAKNLRNGV